MEKKITIGDLLDLEREVAGIKITEAISEANRKEAKIITLREIQSLACALYIGNEKIARERVIDIFIISLDIANTLISQERREEYKILLEEAYTNTFKGALEIEEIIKDTPMSSFLLSLTEELDKDRHYVEELITLSVHLGISQDDLYNGALEMLKETMVQK